MEEIKKLTDSLVLFFTSLTVLTCNPKTGHGSHIQFFDVAALSGIAEGIIASGNFDEFADFAAFLSTVAAESRSFTPQEQNVLASRLTYFTKEKLKQKEELSEPVSELEDPDPETEDDPNNGAGDPPPPEFDPEAPENKLPEHPDVSEPPEKTEED